MYLIIFITKELWGFVFIISFSLYAEKSALLKKHATTGCSVANDDASILNQHALLMLIPCLSKPESHSDKAKQLKKATKLSNSCNSLTQTGLLATRPAVTWTQVEAEHLESCRDSDSCHLLSYFSFSYFYFLPICTCISLLLYTLHTVIRKDKIHKGRHSI